MDKNTRPSRDATRASSRPGTPSSGEVDRLYGAIERRRAERRALIVQNAASAIGTTGIRTDKLSDRLVGDILDGGAREDDPDLQALWANLLANALTDAEPVPRAFPELMRQLEPIEARLLSELGRQEEGHLPGSWVEFHELSAVEGQVEWRHLDNLERLGLFRFETTYPQNVDPPSQPPRDSVQISMLLTPLGHAFLDACQATDLERRTRRLPGAKD